jgi:hypothetical protein
VALIAPMIAIPVIVFTALVLAVDAAISPWTFARQTVSEPLARSGCGLGDHIEVPRRTSMRSLAALTGASNLRVPGWVPAAPVPAVPRFPLAPAGGETVRSPWFQLPDSGRVGFFAAGAPSIDDTLSVEWGRRSRRGIEPLDAERVRVDLASDVQGIHPWRFLTASELAPRPDRANTVRIALRDNGGSVSSVAVTAPVVYETRQLGSLLQRSQTLVQAQFSTYLPCATLPALHDGEVDIPQYLVTDRILNDLPMGYLTSPFRGVSDLYSIERISIADSGAAPVRSGVRIYEVHEQIEGGLVAPPDVRSE